MMRDSLLLMAFALVLLWVSERPARDWLLVLGVGLLWLVTVIGAAL